MAGMADSVNTFRHDAPQRADDGSERGQHAAATLQTARFANSQEFPEQSPKVVRRGRQQVALRDLRQPDEPAATHAAGLADVGEAPLTPFAPQPLQMFALLPS